MSDEILQQLHFMGFDWLDVMQAIDKQLQTQAARIAELEAILEQLLDAHSPTLEVVKRIGRAALAGSTK